MNAYARFTRRVQAVLVDTIIFMFILAGALAVAVSFASDSIARILGLPRPSPTTLGAGAKCSRLQACLRPPGVAP